MNYSYATDEQVTQLVELGIPESTARLLSPTEAMGVIDTLLARLVEV